MTHDPARDVILRYKLLNLDILFLRPCGKLKSTNEPKVTFEIELKTPRTGHGEGFSFLCRCKTKKKIYVNERCMRLPFIRCSIAGVPSSQALPGYLITAPPSVCVPDEIGALPCGFQTPKKKIPSTSNVRYTMCDTLCDTVYRMCDTHKKENNLFT